VKTKHFIGLFLVIIGTNLFTFSIARYWTTQHVLTRAQERLDEVLRKDGLYDQIYFVPEHGKIPSQVVDIPLAIRNAGGMYYWWNDAIGYWFFGVLLVPFGIGIMFYEPRKKIAASYEGS